MDDLRVITNITTFTLNRGKVRTIRVMDSQTYEPLLTLLRMMRINVNSLPKGVIILFKLFYTFNCTKILCVSKYIIEANKNSRLSSRSSGTAVRLISTGTE